ncbi:MAG: 23S rRNA (adenine(2503)-C(2))-methyltransferase RlmN [Melioribacteraceae bacterium]|nr:23S rRNA (adenine(2503)-C(2))-methyltransferase RlmN [Melioribacteraceae bacterium]
MNSSSKIIELKGLTRERMREFFSSIDEKPFRGDQVFNWIYNHLEFDFDRMLNLPKSLREKLNIYSQLNSLKLETTQNSLSTGTKKYLFNTSDNRKIESVVIPEKNRKTLCISTQVGCPLDCKFCATGVMGYKRNLTTGEIVDQYLLAAKEYGKENITNIVYMGMGEPLINFENTIESLKIFTDELNKGLSRNRITVSTAGIPDKIRMLADSGLRVKLALSLHSCFDERRDIIMPINKKYPLKDVFEACKYYSHKTKTRITFEYTMLKNINDRQEDVEALIRLSRQMPSKVNVIPFNSIKHMNPEGISAELEPTGMSRILEFVDKLRTENVTVMIRDTQGDDISAACGQLAVKSIA